jgi:hypothetical protein
MNGITRRELLGAFGSGTMMHGVSLTGMLNTCDHRKFSSIQNPMQFGAKGDGKALDSPAINAAVEACVKVGGGLVYLQPGIYRCGTIHLKSNITLYVEAGATILGSTELSDYTPQPGGYSNHGDTGDCHLIFAEDAENVTLAGFGRIDGQGPAFWKPSGIPPLPVEDTWADVIARSVAAKSVRPSPMLEFVNCQWLHIENLRIENSSSWTIRPINCRQVVIQGIFIKNPIYGHNTDGIDITGCTDVLISDCSIETGDDAICLKSENPYGAEPPLSKNIVVTNCVLTTCSNAFKIGTATQGGFENITFSNSVIYNNDDPFKNRVIAGIALEVVDGGWIEGVVITGIQMQRVRTPIFVRLGNRSCPHNHPEHGLRGISIENIHASGTLLASSITGLPGTEVRDVSLSNIRVDNVLPCRPEWVGRDVPEKEKDYPEARMFGMLPASGLYVRHVHNLRLQDLTFSATKEEARPTVILDDVISARISRLNTTEITGKMPMIQMKNVREMWISESAAPLNVAALVEVQGSRSGNILISGNDCRGAQRTSVLSNDTPAGAVLESGNFSISTGK